MAKTKISEFSTTAADNTDITNINIAEGCSPANLNNAVRSLMALLKDQQTGSITGIATVTALGGYVVSGFADINGFAIVTVSPNAILAGFAYVEGVGTVTANGTRQGEGWTPVVPGTETWTPVSAGSETWSAISPSSDTWSTITAGTETWTDISPGNDIWLRQG